MIEVWESADASDRNMEQIGPDIEAAGIPEPNVVAEFEVHNEQHGG